MTPILRIARAPWYAGPLPTYQTEGASGLDLRAATSLSLATGDTGRVRTGIMLSIPDGYEGQIRPRSSISGTGITVHLGTIDSDYRGEVEIIVTASNRGPLYFRAGDRIAQLVICPVARCEVVEVSASDLTPTTRGAGGFGSTGAR